MILTPRDPSCFYCEKFTILGDKAFQVNLSTLTDRSLVVYVAYRWTIRELLASVSPEELKSRFDENMAKKLPNGARWAAITCYLVAVEWFANESKIPVSSLLTLLGGKVGDKADKATQKDIGQARGWVADKYIQAMDRILGGVTCTARHRAVAQKHKKAGEVIPWAAFCLDLGI